MTNYGYAVDQDNQGDSFGEYVIGLTAISKDDYVEQPMAPYYNDIFSCSVVTIRAKEDSKKKWWGDSESAAGQTNTDVQFNGFDFIIHDIWRTDNCNNEFLIESKSLKLYLNLFQKEYGTPLMLFHNIHHFHLLHLLIMLIHYLEDQLYYVL